LHAIKFAFFLHLIFSVSTDEYPKSEAGYFDWLLGWTSYLDSNGKGYETNETQPQEEGKV
jgi:hypothetical protein